MHGKNQDDDTEAMQQAFQQFMLSSGSSQATTGEGNSSQKKKKGKKQANAARSASSTPNTHKSPASANNNNLGHEQRSFQRQKFRKQYWKLLNAFEKTLQEDWIDVDDHLGDVIASIVNLRDRIRMSSKYLRKWQQQQDEQSQSSMPSMSGYRNWNRPSPSVVVGSLTSEDVELALSHDLMKHEKMLAGTRRLLASLNQAQEALGRRLDELIKFHLDMNQVFFGNNTPENDNDDDDDLELLASQVVDWSRHVYTELALELYRKQNLAQALLDSTTDQLFYQEDDEVLLLGGDDDEDSSAKTPIQEAEKCHRLWPRSNTEGGGSSCLAELLVTKPWEQRSVTVL